MNSFYRPTPPVPDKYIPKWDRSALREGFVPFPRRLMRCLDKVFMGKDAIGKLQVVLAIADSKRLEPFRPPTVDFLAYNAGMSQDEFMGYVSELQQESLISVSDNDPKHFDVDLHFLLQKVEQLTPIGS